MNAPHDFIVVADERLVLDDWEITSDHETWPLSSVFEEIAWRPGLKILFSTWNRGRYTVRFRGPTPPVGPLRFAWQEPFDEVLRPGGENPIRRDRGDFGFRYQISFSNLAGTMGSVELRRRVSELFRPCEAPFLSVDRFSLRLSPDSVYFHEALTAFLFLVDARICGVPLGTISRNVVVHPATTAPQTKALGVMISLDWLCFEHDLRLFVLTLDPGGWKYLRHARFIDASENDLYRPRLVSGQPATRRPLGLFMAWDGAWSPSAKGLPLVLDLFRRHGIRHPLHVKVPDGYPDDSPFSDEFFRLIEEARKAGVDVRAIRIPGGRDALLKAIEEDVGIFLHAGGSDVGPRVVLEAAERNCRILLYDGDDCDLLRFGLFGGAPGFRTFGSDDLPAKIEELERETPRTAEFLETRNWLRTRDRLRAAALDPAIRGFWMDGTLVPDLDGEPVSASSR